MKFFWFRPSAAEWRSLLPQVVFALLCLVGTGVMGWWWHGTLREANTALQQARQERSAAEQRLQQSSSEGIEIRHHAELFNRLVDHGMLGEERRLEWTELLRRAETRLKLSPLDYEFQPRIVLEGTTPASKGYRFYNSRMRLRVHLVEEDDLLRLLRLLQQEAPALVRVQGCKLERLPASAENTTRLEQLDAECQLDWITAQLPGAE